MHAYLFTGVDSIKIDSEIGNLAKKNRADILTFSLTKIADVRSLEKFTLLKQSKKTLIWIKDLEKSSTETQNSFLKNLEEPQENILVALQANSKHLLLPTIVSRCIEINVISDSQNPKYIKLVTDFVNKNTSEKLQFLDQFKKREEALEFSEKLLEGLLYFAKKITNKTDKFAKYLDAASNLRLSLSKNANVTLALTKFVIDVN